VSAPPTSIVAQATQKARRAVALAIGGAALVVLVMIGERVAYHYDQISARHLLANAYQASNDVLLTDEQLTMSAFMAAATGDERWVERYDAALPKIDDALARAIAIAPPTVAAQFERETLASNDALVRLESEAFRAIATDDAASAHALLDSVAYGEHKRTLSNGVDRLIHGVFRAVQANLRAGDLRGSFTMGAAGIFSLLGSLLLWRRLISGLSQSEGAMVDAENDIRNLARTDVLTGLSNRRALLDSLDATLARAERARTNVAVVMIDLDRFKPINDRYGHLIGDLVLKEVARRLNATLRSGEQSARFGGDEFVIIMATPRNSNAPMRVIERVIAALAQPMEVDGLALRIGASAGIAVYPDDALNSAELMRRADVALYQAKKEGRGLALSYVTDMDEGMAERASLETELSAAISTDQIVPYFQPLVDLKTGGPIGFEVLCRWKHPTRGLLAPADFIPIAEQKGLIGDLTFALLRSACIAARDLPAHMRIAINISPQLLEDAWLAEKIMAVLTEVGFAPQRLEVELTENALVNDLESVKRVITSLKNLGVSISLDDFGTGYSSLCYLSELPFDKIKIDRSFIRALDERPDAAKLVRAIVGLGHSLGVPTVAEGVETERVADYLRGIGCDAAQGWLYAKAAPADIVVELAAASHTPPTHGSEKQG